MTTYPRFATEAPFCGAAEAPVAAAPHALIAGVAGDSPGDACVHAIDVVARRSAWTATLPSDAFARELATSLPLPRSDGGAWLAVHQFDGGVVVHGVDAGGRADARIDLPDEYPLCGASDVSSKVMLRLAAAGDAVLCSWTYRQAREYGVVAYSGGKSLWNAPEWLLACDGRTAVTCPVPDRAERNQVTAAVDRMRIVAREATTGAMAARRRRRHRRGVRRRHALSRRSTRGAGRCSCAARVRRSAVLDGVIDEAGLEAVLETGAACDPISMPGDRAAVLATDEAVVVLTPEKWFSLGWDGVVQGTGAVPCPCFGFEPRIMDRWLTVPSAALVAGRLVLRCGRETWIVDRALPTST